jgi:hypothetical protein
MGHMAFCTFVYLSPFKNRRNVHDNICTMPLAATKCSYGRLIHFLRRNTWCIWTCNKISVHTKHQTKPVLAGKHIRQSESFNMVYQGLRDSGFWYCRTEVRIVVSWPKLNRKRELLQHSTVMLGVLLLALLPLLLLLLLLLLVVVVLWWWW